MWRKPGPIPSIDGQRLPSRMIVFDTEAYRSIPVNGVELQTLRLGVARYIGLDGQGRQTETEYYQFETVAKLSEFIQWFTRKDKCLYVYCHNLKYDLQLSGLLTYLIEDGWKVGLFVISDPPTFIRLKRGRMSILLVDTFNYWQFSIARMGEQLGLPKLSMPDSMVNNAAWYRYCTRDVDVLTNYLLSYFAWLVDNDLAPLGLTLASQAFRSYRHRFMVHEIILHNDEKVTKLERDAYSGGRVEAYYIGQAPIQDYYKLDVNSMYPYVMKERTYPYELVAYAENVPVVTLEENLANYYCIASVGLSPLDCAYPVKLSGKLVFPAGRFVACLHQLELFRALQRNEIYQVNRLAIYNRASLFSDYVDYYYGQKQQASLDNNPILRQQAKLFLNSLYGKFGQYEIASKYVANSGPDSYQRITGYSETLGKRVEVNYLGNVIQVSYPQGEAAYSFPAIAGAVTAYARMYLFELIERAGKENVYYCDTDSIITNSKGYRLLEDYIAGEVLGRLKVEAQTTHLHITGCKDYTFGDDTKHKGIPGSARRLDDGTWIYGQFRGAKTWLAQGLPTGVEVKQVTKTRKTTYDKGVITPDGYVIPLSL